MIDKLKDIVQDSNLNFLLGSGMSKPYLPTLGRIEILLNELESRDGLAAGTQDLIRASLYRKYFTEVVDPNLGVCNADAGAQDVLSTYQAFIKAINAILLKRKSTILSKEVNVFTTNIDVFLEKASEDLGIEFNDGFSGRFNPRFSLTNFKKTHFKKSLHYDNSSELPVFNLLKLHGSVCWAINKDEVTFSSNLSHVNDIRAKRDSFLDFLPIGDADTVETLSTSCGTRVASTEALAFLRVYEQLLIIVNPTKEKFKHTLMNQTYYEMLRLYANELEKENTLLFVMGFSFEDEHIRAITLRAANSNPTLIIHVLAHSSKGKTALEKHLQAQPAINQNIVITGPTVDAAGTDTFSYDLKTINEKVFADLLKQIDEGGKGTK